jgi:hypothetical protein
MKRWSPFVLSMLCVSVALAEPPPANQTQKAVADLVNKELLAPMKKIESKRKRFSRAMPVPVERRVRVLDTEPTTDARGKAFVRFAIDERHSWHEEGKWTADRMLGCAYASEGEVFVQQGEAYTPARSMLGKSGGKRSDVCQANAAVVVQVAKRE